MKFVKMHGAGNDFIVVEGEPYQHDWPRLAQSLCDRHFGIGGDGVLLVAPSDKAPFQMRVFNPDASEAEMCGNGIRCATKYAVERALVRDLDFNIETLAGLVHVWAFGEGGMVESVRAGVGEPRLAPGEIPVKAPDPGPVIDLQVGVDGQTLKVTCVSMGNPHAVHFTDRPVAEFALETLGPKMARHKVFPRGVNFHVARVLDREHIEARTWERGAGLTMACGSGASATIVAARLLGLVGEEVDITLPGGTLKLQWDGAGAVYLTGPAAQVFEGEMSVDWEAG